MVIPLDAVLNIYLKIVISQLNKDMEYHSLYYWKIICKVNTHKWLTDYSMVHPYDK